jgi:hypothetical protein
MVEILAVLRGGSRNQILDNSKKGWGLLTVFFIYIHLPREDSKAKAKYPDMALCMSADERGTLR